MYFIIINSSNFEDLLFVNKMLYKGAKKDMLYRYMLLWA